MKLSDKTYNYLKWITLIALPALTTFYGVVGSTLNIPHTQSVLTIAVAFTTMLGSMIGISTKQYNKTNNTTEL